MTILLHRVSHKVLCITAYSRYIIYYNVFPTKADEENIDIYSTIVPICWYHPRHLLIIIDDIYGEKKNVYVYLCMCVCVCVYAK